MKNALIFFLIGTITGICSLQVYQKREHAANLGAGEPSLTARAGTAIGDAAVKAEDAASRAKTSAAEKLQEWHLTPDEITADLAKSGRVIRTKVQSAGEAIADARVLAVIKAKYVLDRDLSALDIAVSVNDGEVSLKGVVASSELLGRAVRLALDTEGVHQVTAELAVSHNAH